MVYPRNIIIGVATIRIPRPNLETVLSKFWTREERTRDINIEANADSPTSTLVNIDIPKAAPVIINQESLFSCQYKYSPKIANKPLAILISTLFLTRVKLKAIISPVTNARRILEGVRLQMTR